MVIMSCPLRVWGLCFVEVCLKIAFTRRVSLTCWPAIFLRLRVGKITGVVLPTRVGPVHGWDSSYGLDRVTSDIYLDLNLLYQ
ncbi:hypothetical protein EDD18DRAFT_1184398 [Armillaria luteobubalina]|uniref:Uncharacterized protein n=1 Tax=Armillaria luteobubalina TaxID=153913 RepID=A0AA39PZ45_9AGAR|nr:hypothetical protein EDD18DRAFT_1184398 [Armillaria luteobubalina]